MRLIVVSNRLPITLVNDNDSSELKFQQSIGGLATGLNAFLKANADCYSQLLWIGSPGRVVEPHQQPWVKQQFNQLSCEPIFLPAERKMSFQNGFCNKAIWPTFHYFTSISCYNDEEWENYLHANQLFCDKILEVLIPGDMVWIQDYHLLPLAKLLREKSPSTAIGFFLHIPFPTYEILRTFPEHCCSTILEGMLGADLIGFHTQEYCQYFANAVSNILGYENEDGKFTIDGRTIKFNAYPMGIDFNSIQNIASKNLNDELNHFKEVNSDKKIIFSVDRLDYTKGIVNRLLAFESFLTKNPDWHKKTVMISIVAPSREEVDCYQQLKVEIEEIVGRINGKFGALEWTPVIYQYKAFTQEDIIAFFSLSDVCLVTPLRDGMNLVAKEYIAAKTDSRGVLVLSDTAGAAKELSGAILVNSLCISQIADAMKTALEMDVRDQKNRLLEMQRSLQQSDIKYWGVNYIQDLIQLTNNTLLQPASVRLAKLNLEKMFKEFQSAQRRLILLDYDGTLVPFKPHPGQASPSKNLLQVLQTIAADPHNKLVVISGRDKNTLESWLGDLKIDLVAEHSAWYKTINGGWMPYKKLKLVWKDDVRNTLQGFTQQLPGSFIEEKNFSMVWHYRNADKFKAEKMAKKCTSSLIKLSKNIPFKIMQGNKIIEAMYAGMGKDYAVKRIMSGSDYDFVVAIGDDITDEDMFRALPTNAYSIKVGAASTVAKFFIEKQVEVLGILYFLAQFRAKVVC